MSERRVIMGGIMMPPRRGGPGGRLWFGLVIMALGVLWTLDNLGVLDAGHILRWWPVLLVVTGIVNLSGIGRRRRPGLGLIMLAAGGLLLLAPLGIASISAEQLWPLVLIALGASMLSRTRLGVGQPLSGGDPGALAAAGDPAETVSGFAVWSHNVLRPVAQALRGAYLTAVMGSVTLDLRGAKPVPEGAAVDLMVCWGGVEIVIPEGWSVANEAVVMMGGIEDRTKLPTVAGSPRVVLRGLVLMGGVEIKH